MIKVYLDLGAKRDASDGVMCVAATAFKPLEYKRFVRPWNRILRGWNATAFHATDFYPGGGEFIRDTPQKHERYLADSQEIPHIVGANVSRILAVSFRPEEFRSEAPTEWTDQFGTSLHSASVRLVLMSMGYWAQGIGYRQGFAYFMESGDEDAPEVLRAVNGMKAMPSTGALVQVRSFTEIDKGLARGLEASDFAAWHWNRYYMDRMRQAEGMLGTGKEFVLSDDTARKDFVALIRSSEQKVDVMFLTGAKLKFYFSLFEDLLKKQRAGSGVAIKT